MRLLDDRISLLLKAKLGDEATSPHLAYFQERVPGARAVQIVKRLRRETRRGGIDVSRASDWLSKLEA